MKTRLAAAIGAEPAAEIYREFVATLLGRLSAVGDRRYVAISPAERRADFAKVVSSEWQLVPQSPGDLGARMRHFFDTAFADGAGSVVLLGSDCPTVPVGWVDEAFERLKTESVVLGPCDDGGYYLVGARGETPDIFDDMVWSTEQVFDQTVARLHAQSRSFAVLDTWYDVDTWADLARLAAELRAAPADSPPLAALRQRLEQLPCWKD